MSSFSEPNPYDHVPYDSHPFPQTLPTRLAALARLFGMRPPPPATARVLELGCASGGNLIPMAVRHPDAEFVGIDFSARQIAQGEGQRAALELDNLRLHHADIASVDAAFGQFDYIVCHGVYSWVPAAVQSRILEVARDHLTPHGVAYVSYNTYPGWHMRGMIRDMMLYHTQHVADHQKVPQARALLDFLAANAEQAQSGAYPTLLKGELDILRRVGDYYLRHEHLEEHNTAVYFHEFMDRAQALDLQYLAEADLTSMLASNTAPHVERTLREVAPEILRMEQYMDFLRNRTFRQTLLVHASQPLTRNLTPASLAGLHASAGLTPSAAPGTDAGTGPATSVDSFHATFVTRAGATVGTTSPLVAGILHKLGAAFPRSCPVDELLGAIAPDNPVTGEGDELRDATGLDLLRAVCKGFVELSAEPLACAAQAGGRPRGYRLARHQAAQGPGVTNLRHELVNLDELGRQVLQRLDGHTDRAALGASLIRAAVDGEVQMALDGRPLAAAGDIERAVAKGLPDSLAVLAANALLEA